MRIHPTVKAWLPPTALLLLALIVVGPPLLPWRHLVLAPPQSDIIQQHIGWQEFSASQLRQGIIPLWNPHAGAGQPFVAAWQGAVFYPPTWLCLLMDAGLAINWLLALHLAWAAVGVYTLCRGRRLGYVASTTAGAMFMLCGPMFLRAYAGQYIPLATIAWAPWLFLCLDHVLEGATTAWLLAAIAIVALQFCAGYPQFAYVTALLAGVYVVVNATDVRSFRPLAALAIIYLAAVLLSAAQVFTSFGGALESTRSTGLGVEWAGSYSMPVESLITLIAPGFMGDPHQVFTGGPGIPYFGRFFFGKPTHSSAPSPFSWRFMRPFPFRSADCALPRSSSWSAAIWPWARICRFSRSSINTSRASVSSERPIGSS